MTESPDDIPDGSEAYSIFGMPVPRELVRSIIRDHERDHMRDADLHNRMYELLDSLTVAQLKTLRWMLSRDSAHNDGQIITVLRLKHGVNPDSAPWDDDAAESGELPPVVTTDPAR